MTQLVSLVFILWKVIYSVDSTFQRLNNRGLDSNVNSTCQVFYVFIQEGFRKFLPWLPSNDVSPLGGNCPRGNCNTSGDWVKWLCGHNWRSLRLHFTIFRSMAWCPWGSSYRWVKGQMSLLPQVSHYAYASVSSTGDGTQCREKWRQCHTKDVSKYRARIGSILETGIGVPPLISFPKKIIQCRLNLSLHVRNF